LLDRSTVPDDGSLGVLADPADQGTSRPLSEQMDPNSKTTAAHSYLPLSVRVAAAAHRHQLAVSGCASMIPRARAGDTAGDATFAARQADLQRLGNRSWNPKAKAAALARLFPR
jgi:hypothetical protein